MPDYNDAEEEQGSTNAPRWTQATPQKEPEYVPWSRFSSANQDVSQRNARQLQGQVQGDVDRAQSELGAGSDASTAKNKSNYNSPTSKGAGDSSFSFATPMTVQSGLDAPQTSKGAGDSSFGFAAPMTVQSGLDASAPPLPGRTGIKPTAQSGRLGPRGPNGAAIDDTRPGAWQQLSGNTPDSSTSPRSPAKQHQGPGGGVQAELAPSPGVGSTPHGSIPQSPDPGNPWANFATDTSGAPATDASGAPVSSDGPVPQSSRTGYLMPSKSVNAATTTPSSVQEAGSYLRGQALTPGGLNAKGGDLQDQMGPEAWSKLLTDTENASQKANALGSESGIQGLLQQNASSPIENQGINGSYGAFDAALINGQGAPGFRDMVTKYGGDKLEQGVINAEKKSQDAWSQLRGDQDVRRQFDTATAKARTDEQARIDALDAQYAKDKADAPASQAAPADPATADSVAADSAASDAPDLNKILYDGADGSQFLGTLHQAGLSMSPADWAVIAAGETGNDIPLPTELFASAYDKTGEMKKTWPPGRFQMAWGLLHKDGYPPEALTAFLTSVRDTPGMLKTYLEMKNPGFMLKNMRDWLNNSGYKAGTWHPSELHDVDNASQAANAGWYDTPGGYQEQWRTLHAAHPDWDDDQIDAAVVQPPED